jgi:cysteinyl-tRNA synthetase
VALKIYDTFSRQKKEFVPIKPGHVGMYVCGMTVQGPPHVGHLRAAVVADVIRRYFVHLGYDVTLVHNFTDVDDKIIERAQEEGIDAWTIAKRNIDAYLQCVEKLQVQPPTIMPKASEHIDDIVALIQDLVDKDYAYPAANGDVYFAVERFPGYGKLSGRRVEELRAGARIEVGEEKRKPEDFALWKAAKPGEPAWPSPWGEGRPGWHIECSAMAMRYLGETVDLHGGGMDLVFPHHENELAQSEASTGKSFVHHWIQHGLVNLSGEKMSKSTHHFSLAEDVFATVDPLVVRYYLSTTHYRSPIEFSEERLEESRTALTKLWNFLSDENLDRAQDDGWGADLIADAERRFAEAMDDDFNTAKALGVIFELVRAVHRQQGEEGQQDSTAGVPQPAAAAVAGMLELLGIPTAPSGVDPFPDEALRLLEERNAARSNRDWAKADQKRDQLTALGFSVEDRADGSVLRRI